MCPRRAHHIKGYEMADGQDFAFRSDDGLAYCHRKTPQNANPKNRHITAEDDLGDHQYVLMYDPRTMYNASI